MNRKNRPPLPAAFPLLLLGSAVLLAFSNGRFGLLAISWIAPIPLLRLLRQMPFTRGILVGLLPITASYWVMWHQMIPASGFLYLAIATAYALFYYLPFIAHRALAPRLGRFVSTLVFPSAWIAMELPLERWVTPYGSWGSIAYLQLDLLPLVQIASVTGLFGISFLVAWFGSTVEWLWSERFAWPSVRAAASVFGSVLVAVLVFGSVRLAVDDSAAGAARVAAITPDPRLEAPFHEALTPIFQIAGADEPSESELENIDRLAAVINADLLERSRREARSGARIVAWSETAAKTLKDREVDLLGQAKRLAIDEQVFLLITYIAWTPGSSPPLENKAVAIDPSGTVRWEYLKSHPIVGSEAPLLVPGNGVLPTLDTPHGRLATAICHDLDFPELFRAAGRSQVDLLFAPSADWSGITPLHARMAVFRAIEQGFVLVRPTSGGLSLIADSRGRVLAALDDRRQPAAVLVGHAPLQHARTVYSRVGDLFSWLATIGLAGLAISALRRAPRGRSLKALLTP